MKMHLLPALEPFQYDAPPNILKHVVGQFRKVRNALILEVGEENENESTCFFRWVNVFFCKMEAGSYYLTVIDCIDRDGDVDQ